MKQKIKAYWCPHGCGKQVVSEKWLYRASEYKCRVCHKMIATSKKELVLVLEKMSR